MSAGQRWDVFLAVAYAFFCGMFLHSALRPKSAPAARVLEVDPRVERACRESEKAFHRAMSEPEAAG